MAQTPEEAQLAQQLVEVLNLQDVSPTDIERSTPLFGHEHGSLGLDSIDALEIALMVQRRYGVELRSDDPDTRPAFASLQTLSAYVSQRLSQQKTES